MRTFPVNFPRAVLGVSLLAALCALALPATAQEADLKSGRASFAYTKLDLDKCKLLDQSGPEDEGAGWAHWRCKGLTEDWPVHVMTGDLRFTVSYGPNGPKERAAQQWFASFNRIHDTLEWVQAGKDADHLKPVATILRFFLAVNGGPDEHPVLVVTQLKQGAVCHVAYVDAGVNKNANRDAREAALRLAGSFNCEAEPELVGPQSPDGFGE